ncbi:MAG: ComF family protein [Kiritimatiellae bacterium]|nr:ComF family protein [Kiritimatiellia bacterium]
MALARFLDLLYPRFCVGCKSAVGAGPGYLCWNCRARQSIISEPFCSVCGDPVDGYIERSYTCSWCRNDLPAFDFARSAAMYRGPVKAALCAFKYERATCMSGDMIMLLSACVNVCLANISFDAVTFVPLHPQKERERTFNQSRILASGLAARLDVPLFSKALCRIRLTPTQTNLTMRQRKENVKNAFAVANEDWVIGRRFLLVDDVMTTGATVDECSRVLKEAGAVSVHVVTVARG